MKKPSTFKLVKLSRTKRPLAILLCAGALGISDHSARAASQFWDPTGTSTLGGAGTWDGVTANWAPTNAGGSTTAWTAGSDAIFGGASTYTVTISGTQVANSVQPVNGTASVVTFSGGTLQLGAGGLGSTTTNNNASEFFDNTTAVQLTADQTWSPFTDNHGPHMFGTAGSLTDNGAHTLTVAFTGLFKIAQLSGTNTLNNLTVNDTVTTNTYVGVNFGAAGTATASLGTSTNTTTNNSTIAGTLTLGGTNQGATFAAVSSNLSVDKIAAGTNTANGGNGLLIGNGGTVTVGYLGGSSTFAGHILNTIGTTTPGIFKKAGAGTLTLTGDNSTTTNIGLLGNSTGFSGTWELNGGTLNAGSANALGAVGSTFKFTGGALQYSASNTVDISGRIANSTGAIAIDTNGQNVTFASAIANTNTGGLTKSGAGILSLGGANAFTGTVTVNAGTLSLASNISLDSSIVLSLAPNSSLDLGFASGSQTVQELFLNGAAVTPGTYTSTQLNTLGSSSTITFTSSGGTLTVTAVPEPATMALMSIGLVCVLFGFRRNGRKLEA
jgi:autotransporter-associated beta strand protein